jgi:transcriptional regulatory protein GAL4
VHDLEELVSQLLPGVDIDDALDSPGLPTASPFPVRQTPEVFQPTQTPSPRGSQGTATEEPVIPEAVPNNADGFNWQEEDANLNSLTDGMAALSVEPTGVGYLGSTSGVVFLRCLLDWAGFLHQSQARPFRHRRDSPNLLHGALASSQLSHATLTNQVSSNLIDAYFHDYHCVYPFVHEATFRAQYHEIVPRPPQRSWDMLYYAILALGAWSLNNDQVGLEDHLYRRALTLGQHESVFEATNLTSIQALILLSNLSQKKNSPNTGWNLLGLAVRNALSIALHRELPHWNISLLDREIRRRVWWGLYIFDSGASTTFGRSIMLPDQDSMNVHSVLNIDDEVGYLIRSVYIPLTKNSH